MFLDCILFFRFPYGFCIKIIDHKNDSSCYRGKWSVYGPKYSIKHLPLLRGLLFFCQSRKEIDRKPSRKLKEKCIKKTLAQLAYNLRLNFRCSLFSFVLSIYIFPLLDLNTASYDTWRHQIETGTVVISRKTSERKF